MVEADRDESVGDEDPGAGSRLRKVEVAHRAVLCSINVGANIVPCRPWRPSVAKATSTLPSLEPAPESLSLDSVDTAIMLSYIA